MKLIPHAIPLEALGVADTQLISFVLGENNRVPNQKLDSDSNRTTAS